MNAHLETFADEEYLSQKLIVDEAEVFRWIINTRDKTIRSHLTAMGWLPPLDEPVSAFGTTDEPMWDVHIRYSVRGGLEYGRTSVIQHESPLVAAQSSINRIVRNHDGALIDILGIRVSRKS